MDIDFNLLANSLNPSKSIFLRILQEKLEYKFDFIDSSETMWLNAISKENDIIFTVKLAASQTYAKALLAYMREEHYKGYRLDSYVTPIIMEAILDSVQNFYQRNDVINCMTANIQSQIIQHDIKINQKDVTPNAGNLSLRNTKLALKINEEVKLLVVSQSFREAMRVVLEDVRNSFIYSTVLTTVVSTLIVVGFSVKGSVFVPFLIPILAFIIVGHVLTFKKQLKKGVGKKLNKKFAEEYFAKINLQACEFIINKIGKEYT